VVDELGAVGPRMVPSLRSMLMSSFHTLSAARPELCHRLQ
jgi:hypothetical protein